MLQLACPWLSLALALCRLAAPSLPAGDVKDTAIYARIKASLDAVAAIDTHSHLGGPQHFRRVLDDELRGDKPTDCALRRVWAQSYMTWGHPLARWPEDGRFQTWWNAAQADFADYRARSAYRAMLPIFADLFGVDFESITDVGQARALNARMEQAYGDPDWARQVLVERANIALMVVDSFVMPTHVRDHFPFTVSACNVRWYIDGFHSSEFARRPGSDPYAFAAAKGMPTATLDDYIAVLDRIIAEARQAGAICLKSQNAYDRTLCFDRVDKQRAEQVFGRPRSELDATQIKAFEDYVFWQLVELSARHDLPFQIHTGHARIQGSNPMNLVDLIQANPRTKFILFHGGFPWVGETGMIALRYPNVYLDSVWLPTLSYTMAKRAFQEWLEMISSDRILWGSDMFTIEGSYGTAMLARQCIAEALAEKVLAKELREVDAVRIGRQILRDNALRLFPALRERVD